MKEERELVEAVNKLGKCMLKRSNKTLSKNYRVDESLNILIFSNETENRIVLNEIIFF